MPAPALVSRVVAAAVRAKYHPTRLSGGLLLTGSVLDPFVYAGIVYFVLSAVFERTGFDRFQFLLIGFIAFRWTLSCLLDAANFAELRSRMREVVPQPSALALVAVLAPPTLVFLLSLAAAILFSIVWNAPGQSFASIGWLLLVVPVQAVWNAVLVLLVDRLKGHGILSTETPLVVATALLWIMTPTMYRFEDVPPAIVAPFTTLNPASHMLAAYQNSYWFGLPISLKVLPAAGLVGLVLLLAMRDRRAGTGPEAGPRPDREREDGQPEPLLIVTTRRESPDPPVVPTAGEATFSPWRGQTRNFHGEDLALLIAATWSRDMDHARAAVRGIAAASGLDRLFEDDLAIYPDWALSQLAFAVALASPFPHILLDGVLDAADPGFVRDAWRRLEAECAAGRRATVVTYRLLSPPENAIGSFRVVRGGKVTSSGALGAELDAVFRTFRDTGALP